MTDYDRVLEFFRALGIEPAFSEYNGRRQILLDAEYFGGYTGFFARFDFDEAGKFLPGLIDTEDGTRNPNSNTGVWE